MSSFPVHLFFFFCPLFFFFFFLFSPSFVFLSFPSSPFSLFFIVLFSSRVMAICCSCCVCVCARTISSAVSLEPQQDRSISVYFYVSVTRGSLRVTQQPQGQTVVEGSSPDYGHFRMRTVGTQYPPDSRTDSFFLGSFFFLSSLPPFFLDVLLLDP